MVAAALKALSTGPAVPPAIDFGVLIQLIILKSAPLGGSKEYVASNASFVAIAISSSDIKSLIFPELTKSSILLIALPSKSFAVLYTFFCVAILSNASKKTDPLIEYSCVLFNIFKP